MPPRATGSRQGASGSSRRGPAAAQTARRLERGGDGEAGQERRKRDQERAERVQELPSRRLLGIHEDVVEADGQAEDQEHHEDDPAHLVGEEVSAGRLRHDRVEGHVGRDQPEIDDRMERPREERAREARRRLSGARPSETGRSWNTTSSTTPTIVQAQRIAQAVMPNWASGTARPGFSRFQRDSHRDRDDDPGDRPDQQQGRAGIEGPVRDHRRIEGVEHRGLARDDRERGDEGAGEHRREARPGQARPADGPPQARRGDEVAEARG